MLIIVIYFHFSGYNKQKGVILLKFAELKQDFYKRFRQSDNFLHFTSTGLLCTLLGHSDIKHAPSLTCSLSMRVQMFARRLGGSCIDIQDVTKSEGLSYRFGTPTDILHSTDRSSAEIIRRLEDYGISGAQILYERTVPDFLPCEEEFAVCLVRSLLKIADKEADTLKIVSLASGNVKSDNFIAVASAKKGYCTHISKGDAKMLPLPLSGYKIISVHCKGKPKDRNTAVKYAFNSISRLYPHISSVADITPETLIASKSVIKDKTALRYMYHLTNENARLVTVSRALKRCDIKTLFNEMNMSQKSLERFWNLSEEEIYLAHSAKNVDGIRAVRSWKNGIIAIAENEYVDHAIEMIKNNFESNIGYSPYFCVSDAF